MGAMAGIGGGGGGKYNPAGSPSPMVDSGYMKPSYSGWDQPSAPNTQTALQSPGPGPGTGASGAGGGEDQEEMIKKLVALLLNGGGQSNPTGPLNSHY